MSFNDSVMNMPEYLKKILKNSWAHPFQEIIFPAINEDRFEVLYSKKPSRPNSPVNVIIGALILKEIFQLSDAELLGSIYFDDLEPDEIKAKDAEELDSNILQNPSDPDATYRFKYGHNIGYTANIVELFDGDNSIIKAYDLKPNIYSDQKFSNDTIEKLAKNIKIFNPVKMIVDGTYFTFNLAKKAISKGIELIPGQLVGRKQSESKMSYAETFKINRDKLVTECANDQKPFYSNYDVEKEVCTAKYSKEVCSNCSLKKECRIKFQKKANTVRFNLSRYQREIFREKMKTDKYIALTNQRAGVEGLPSVFRRKYQVDSMPVRGEVRSKFYFGFKVLASNVKKLFKRPGVVTG